MTLAVVVLIAALVVPAVAQARVEIVQGESSTLIPDDNDALTQLSSTGPPACVGPPRDINIAIQITADQNDDIRIQAGVVFPEVTIWDGHGGASQGVQVVLDDEANGGALTNAVGGGAAPYSIRGVFRPHQPLTALDDSPAGSVVSLWVTDKDENGLDFDVDGWQVIYTCEGPGDGTVVSTQNLALADSGISMQSLSVPSGTCVGPVRDVNVGVSVQHARNADLAFSLLRGGTTVALGSGIGSSSSGMDLVLDDEARQPVAMAAVAAGQDGYAVEGRFKPTQALSAFDGVDASAMPWTLRVSDTVVGNTGEVVLWRLNVVCATTADGSLVSPDRATIPDYNPNDFIQGVMQSITGPADCTVEDVDVRLLVAHSYVGDLEMSLALDGTLVRLVDNYGGSVDGYDVVFDDEASGLISAAPTNGADPYAVRGTHRPLDALSAFDGADAAGQWTLTVRDQSTGDLGEIQKWSLVITCEGDGPPDPEPPGPQPPPAPPGPGPGPEPPAGEDEVVVLAGANRVETGVMASQDAFPEGAAPAAVLARADQFADALAGTPLAVKLGGPLLLTSSTGLDAATADELERLLAADATVWLLGGEAALSDAVEDAVGDLGFDTMRLSGASRFETAIAIADELGDVAAALLTTGGVFPDALTAGAAAASVGGAVLLTNGDQPHPATEAWLAGHGGVDQTAIGGPAAAAHPDADALMGASRYETAVAVADAFFTAPTAVGIASGESFPDGLTGGAHAGLHGAPLLLTPKDSLHPAVEAWLADHAPTIATAYVYGGPAAVADDTVDEVTSAIA